MTNIYTHQKIFILNDLNFRATKKSHMAKKINHLGND